MSIWAVTITIGHDAAVPDGAADVEADHVGQAQVEEHQVGLVALEQRQAGAAVPGLVDLVALVLEREADDEADLVVVFDEEQTVHRAS